ncbi:MAG TPA: 2-oxoacid:acceptor oxidoreductase subunit alpha [Gemmatimonadales bacterium]|nr:2-oxoacid:acceptor oxidoreductase subunit alpha [Gemmatimonadales bacterium]
MSPSAKSTAGAAPASASNVREQAVVRFAGDSGDGMQITGSRFTMETALAGNDLATFPDFPAEIRAPVGTTFGVSAFQIHFGSVEVTTAGDDLDVLVAMNPAALTVNIKDLRRGGTLLVDAGAFTERNLSKAGYATNPLEDGSLADFRLIPVDIGKLTEVAVEGMGLTSKQTSRSRNMWALGLVLWLYGRDRKTTTDWLERKFRDEPAIAAANVAVLNAGHIYGETAELPSDLRPVLVGPAPASPGTYRTISGTEAVAWGLVAGLRAAGLEKMVFAGYPITPASPVLQVLTGLRAHGVVTFQAEDEIAAICAAIGASFAGSLGVTSSSGPGIALKTEALGLAIATELPLIVIDSQRAGPSTGLPTKTEQSDLFQAVLGRNGDAPLPVLAAATPSDCFEVAIEAVRLATKYMTPVFLLTDGYLANAAEPWHIPDPAGLPSFPIRFRTDPDGFQPFQRDAATLARPWAVPGTPGLEHRVGGLERSGDTGNISYDPDNHARMTELRAAKVAGIAADIPEQGVSQGEDRGELAVVGWGSTFGPIHMAVQRARVQGRKVSHIHLRYVAPFPRNLGDLLGRFDKILVPEMNNGQLVTLLRAAYLLPAERFCQVNGKPFKVSTIHEAILARTSGNGKGGAA